MRPAPLACTRCHASIDRTAFQAQGAYACPVCGADLELGVFPALFRKFESTGRSSAVVLNETSTCFYHASRAAVVVCEDCGRFLCSLCEVEYEGKRLCPKCISVARKKGDVKVADQRVRYDQIALSIAVLPILMFPFTLFTAPIALYASLRYWKYPLSVVHRGRAGLLVAGLIAFGELALWSALIVTMLV